MYFTMLKWRYIECSLAMGKYIYCVLPAIIFIISYYYLHVIIMFYSRDNGGISTCMTKENETLINKVERFDYIENSE